MLSLLIGYTDTLWLTVTNIVLGAAVLISTLGLAVAVARELIGRKRRQARLSAELDRDMRELVARYQNELRDEIANIHKPEAR